MSDTITQEQIFRYCWKNPEGDDILKRHRLPLLAHAKRHAKKLIDEGYHEGLLVLTLSNDCDDPSKGETEYRGYWEMKVKNIDVE